MTTFTRSLRLWQGQPLDPSIRNAWATYLNINDDLLDNAVTGIVQISLDGLTSYTLSTANGAPDEARSQVVIFRGALAGDCTINLPNVPKLGWAANQTTGGHNLILSAGAGIKATITPTGALSFYAADGNGAVAMPSVGFGGIQVNSLAIPGAFSSASVTTGPVTATSVTSSGVITATGEVVSGVGQGSVHLAPGGLANTGYIGFYTPAGVRAGYVGFGGSGNLNIQCDAGYTGWTVGGTLTVTGNLRTNGQLSANSINSDSGTFYIGGNPNYYLNRNSVDGAWRFVDNGVITCTLDNLGNLTARGNISATAGVVYASGTFYMNANNGGSQLLNFASNQYIQFTPGFGFTYNTTGQHSFNGVLIHNGVEVCSNDGRTYTININGSAGSAGSVGWAGVSGVPGQISSLNQSVNTTADVHFARATCSGTIYAQGNDVASAGGLVMDTGSVHGPEVWTLGCGIISLSAISASYHVTASDARVKSHIEDLSVDEAVEWVWRARPRKYLKDGNAEYGVVAQEDWESGRRIGIAAIPDNDPRVAVSDGVAEAGFRLHKDYQQEIAPLITVVQSLLKELDAAKRRIAALEADRADP